ncbi:hypothetical protein VN97_g764 [Penicillium thymicola]|uniref:Secreted protein n=1 Tax=Penicillium thymicola TaxID=293382 RepID=A0AAI9TSV9_PENTH|nr:hypothetical protein VN97_g764 [Penicillium thymicola]
MLEFRQLTSFFLLFEFIINISSGEIKYIVKNRWFSLIGAMDYFGVAAEAWSKSPSSPSSVHMHPARLTTSLPQKYHIPNGNIHTVSWYISVITDLERAIPRLAI